MCASVFRRGRNNHRRRNYGNYLIYSDATDVAALPFAVIHDATLAQGASIKHYTNVKGKKCQPAARHTNKPVSSTLLICLPLFFLRRYLAEVDIIRRGRGGSQPGPCTRSSAQPRRRRRRQRDLKSQSAPVCPSVCLSVGLIRALDRFSRGHTGIRGSPHCSIVRRLTITTRPPLLSSSAASGLCRTHPHPQYASTICMFNKALRACCILPC